MSDGISEAYGGTYFRDRSKPPLSEKELIERRIMIIDYEMDDLKWEKQNLEERLEKIK